MDKHVQRIRTQYHRAGGDSTMLFRTILAVAEAIGLEEALACLEQCVTEKRLAWIEDNQHLLKDSGQPLWDGYRLFYESYLGLSLPQDGEIVEQSETRLVTRWWNDCPTLEACKTLGLDTRQVCRLAYQQPVQAMLQCLRPNLRFERNYQALRPHTPYCEEIIFLA